MDFQDEANIKAWDEYKKIMKGGADWDSFYAGFICGCLFMAEKSSTIFTDLQKLMRNPPPTPNDTKT